MRWWCSSVCLFAHLLLPTKEEVHVFTHVCLSVCLSVWASHGFKMVLCTDCWKTFVGGTCALPSALLVRSFVRLFLLAAGAYCVGQLGCADLFLCVLLCEVIFDNELEESLICLAHSRSATCSELLAVDQVSIKSLTSQLQIPLETASIHLSRSLLVCVCDISGYLGICSGCSEVQ